MAKQLSNPQATAIATALQPLNVQIAMLVQAVKDLKSGGGGSGQDKGDPSAPKRAGASWSDLTRGIGASMVVLNQANALINSFGSQLGSLVGAFSPAELELFTIAVKDFHASLGEQLIPLFRAGTEVVRWLADSVAGLTQFIKPLVEALVTQLRPIFEIIGENARILATALIPMVESFSKLRGELLAGLVPMLKAALPATVQILTALASVGLAFNEIGIGIVNAVLPVLTALVQIIMPIVGALVQVIGTLIKIALVPVMLAVKALGIVFEAVAAPLAAIAPIIAALAGAFGKVATLIGGAAAAFGEFATFIMLAVKALGSVFEAVAVPFAAIGSVIAALIDAFGEVATLIGGLVTDVVKALGELMREVFEAIKDVFAPVGSIFTSIVHAMVEGIKDAVTWFREIIAAVREFLGLPGLGRDDPKFKDASRGKGATNAQTTTISAMLAQLDAAAFGAGKAADPAKAATIQVPGLLQGIKTALENLPAKIAAEIAKYLPKVPGGGGGAAEVGASAVGGAVNPSYALREGMKRVTGY